MERIVVQAELSEAHQKRLEADRDQPATYKVNRGANDFLHKVLIPFNPLEHLQKQMGSVDLPTVLSVLDGGCGYGFLLRDLKAGINTKDLVEIDSFDPDGLKRWKKERENTNMRGLNGAIQTTGVTLSSHHADVAERIEESCRPDRIIVGPIEKHDFSGEQFNLIIDFLGSGFYFPDAVLPIYGKALDSKGACYVKLLIGTDSRLASTRTLITTCGMRIIQEGGSSSGHMDFLLEK